MSNSSLSAPFLLGENGGHEFPTYAYPSHLQHDPGRIQSNECGRLSIRLFFLVALLPLPAVHPSAPVPFTTASEVASVSGGIGAEGREDLTKSDGQDNLKLVVTIGSRAYLSN